jgi:protein-disulfide isomerase
MNTKNILIGVGALIVTFGLLFFAYKLTNVPAKAEFPEINVIKKTDNVRWNKDSKNILVEYSDLQCPACKEFYSFLKDLEKTATPNAALVFRHFPLYQIHPNAFSASYAAEAAGLQDKFWEMESALYEKQSEWSALPSPKDYFVKLAGSLELDVEKFKKDLDSQAVKDRVQVDVSEAEGIGVNSTPSFFLNGRIVNVASMEEFKQLILSL